MCDLPMENFLFTFNAVVPLFVTAGLGGLVRKWGWLSPEAVRQLNTLCFRLLIPCSLFNAAAGSDFGENFSPPLVGYAVFSYVAATALLWVLVPRFVKRRGQAGSVIHGAYRSNTILFGIPLAVNLFGEAGAVPMALLVTALIPLFNVMGVVVLSFFSETNAGRPAAGRILRDIATNPLIIAACLGLTVSMAQIELPVIVSRPVADLAACGTPMAMLALGAQFNPSSALRHLRLSLPAVFVKLVALPLAVTAGGILLGLRGVELGAIFVVHAAPSAATSAMMAQSMGCDGELGGEIILISTFLSVFTIFSGVLICRSLGLF